MSESMYGVKLKSARRFFHQDVVYHSGKSYAVPRDLRDHLVGSGYFVDTLVESAPPPTPIEPRALEGNDPGLETIETLEPDENGVPRRGRGRPRKPSPEAFSV